MRSWPTVSEIAGAISGALVDDDIDWAVRFLCDGLSRVTALYAAYGLDEALAAPGTTGSVEWDTLIAVGLQHHLAKRGLASPAWTRVTPLASEWTPLYVNEAKAARDRRETPPELARVRIYWSARNFESA